MDRLGQFDSVGKIFRYSGSYRNRYNFERKECIWDVTVS